MKTMMKRLALAATVSAALMGLAACETATPYQPLAAGNKTSGGYSDTQIEANRFKVSFSGNDLTSRETVERYLLLRAAELTLSQGDDWFEAVDRSTDRKTEVFTEPGPIGCSYGPGWCGGYWGARWSYYRRGAWGYWDPLYRAPLDVHEISQYTASAEIVMGKGDKPAGNVRAFNAREVLQHLSPAAAERPKP